MLFECPVRVTIKGQQLFDDWSTIRDRVSSYNFGLAVSLNDAVAKVLSDKICQVWLECDFYHNTVISWLIS